jgi:hypothetical protein
MGTQWDVARSTKTRRDVSEDQSFTVTLWFRVRSAALPFRGLLFAVGDDYIVTENSDLLPGHIAALLASVASAGGIQPGTSSVGAISLALYLDTAAEQFAVMFKEAPYDSPVHTVALPWDARLSAGGVWHHVALATRWVAGRRVFTSAIDGRGERGLDAPRTAQAVVPHGIHLPRLSTSLTSAPWNASAMAPSSLLLKRGGSVWVGVTAASGDDNRNDSTIDMYNVRVQRGVLTRQRSLMIAGLLRHDQKDAPVTTAAQEARQWATTDVRAAIAVIFVVLLVTPLLVGVGVWRIVVEHRRSGRSAGTLRALLVPSLLAAFILGPYRLLLYMHTMQWPEHFRRGVFLALWPLSLDFSAAFPVEVPMWADWVAQMAVVLVGIAVVWRAARRDTDQFIREVLEPLARRRVATCGKIPLHLMHASDDALPPSSELHPTPADDAAFAAHLRGEWERGTLDLAGIVVTPAMDLPPEDGASVDTAAPFLEPVVAPPRVHDPVTLHLVGSASLESVSGPVPRHLEGLVQSNTTRRRDDPRRYTRPHGRGQGARGRTGAAAGSAAAGAVLCCRRCARWGTS